MSHHTPKCPCGRPDCLGCGAMSELECRCGASDCDLCRARTVPWWAVTDRPSHKRIDWWSLGAVFLSGAGAGSMIRQLFCGG